MKGTTGGKRLANNFFVLLGATRPFHNYPRVSSNRSPQAMISRVWNTAVFWTWLVNGFRLGSAVLVMPVLLRVLSETDLTVYWQFVFLSGFGYTLDAMFATTITRHVSYATRGAADIQALGLDESAPVSEKPNLQLLGQLFSATKRLYWIISLVILLLLGTGGTLVIWPLVSQTSNPTFTWMAWVVTILGSCLELYTGYWLVFLRGMNQIVLSTRLSAIIYGAKLLLAVVLLLAGFGLLAAPISSLITGIAQRLLARRIMKGLLPADFRPDESRDRELAARIWPTSWRMGVVGLSTNVMLVGFGSMISHMLGAHLAYRYQFSQQIMQAICINMATVWTFVKWPTVMQLRVANDLAGMRKLLWPRIWLQNLTLAALGLLAIFAAHPVLKIIAPEKELLPQFWLVVLAAHALLELQYVFWTTLLTSENRIPSMWAAVGTNLSSLAVAFVLVKTTDLGLAAFVVAPLASGLAFNYWYWPWVGAKSLGTTWLRYMFRKPVSG